MSISTLIRAPKIIMKLTSGCVTGCNLCHEGQKKIIDYTDLEVSMLKANLNKLFSIIDISYLEGISLYGGDAINSKYLFDFYSFIKSTIPQDVVFYVNSPNIVPYNKETFQKIMRYKKKYNIEPIFVRNIADLNILENKTEWVKFFSFLNLHPDIFSPLSFRYGQEDDKELKWLYAIEKRFPNIDFAFGRHPGPDHKKNLFVSDKLGTDDCKYYSYSLFQNNMLHLTHPENEINLLLNGDITMHTNICYLSKYRYITNIHKSIGEMSDEIENFYNQLKRININSNSLGESCYKCIYGY